MPRLLHTADWQLGLTFPSHGAAADALRDARFAVVARLLELADERAVDLILVAGDVFESADLPGARLLELIEMLARATVPVLLLPGNHDPHVPGGVWERPEWEQAPAHIERLLDASPRRFDGLVVHPCPLTSPHARVDPCAALPDQRADEDAARAAVGLAHGALRGRLNTMLRDQGRGDDHPIDLDAPGVRALDYLALGDWHSTRLETDDDGRVVAAYAGTPEPTRALERDSGNALIVDLPGPGQPVAVEAVPVARYRWLALDECVERTSDVAALAQRLNELRDADRIVLELRLSGAAELAALEAVDQLEPLTRRFASCRLQRDALSLSLPPEQIAELAPPGPLGEAVRRVAAELAREDSPRRRAAEEALRLFAALTADEATRD